MNRPFLRLPPFPRHRAPPIATRSAQPHGQEDAHALADALRRHRVGSDYWLAPAGLSQGHDVLICPSSPHRLPGLVEAARRAGVLDRTSVRGGAAAFPASCDPWRTCEQAAMVIADGDDEWALVAALVRRPLIVVGNGRFAALSGTDCGDDALARVVHDELMAGRSYQDPFGDGPIAASALVELLGTWRRMIEANRQFAAITGVAGWKRVTTDALLWDGTSAPRYSSARSCARRIAPGETVLAWTARSDGAGLAQLRARGVLIGEIEDGLIRSNGLGANCVPPLSITVDAHGPHFDPSRASDLEMILQDANLDEAMLARAVALREMIVARGIGKYSQDPDAVARPEMAPSQRLVLVTGQVEDDRSVLCGGAGLDNLELLRRARAMEPHARVIYKPHPDVEAGHRKGHVPDSSALLHADEIDRRSSIASLLGRVQAIHVMTSLAGFEALLRDVEVVTHGTPFYAGWGLTRDVGPIPARRTRRRTLDELVAATLILYPRYLDPVTRLPCGPEVLVRRIAAGEAEVRTPLILFREALGRMRLLLGRR